MIVLSVTERRWLDGVAISFKISFEWVFSHQRRRATKDTTTEPPFKCSRQHVHLERCRIDCAQHSPQGETSGSERVTTDPRERLSDYPSLQLGSGVRLRQNKNAADRGKPIPGHGNGRDSLLKEQPVGRYLWEQERQSS